MTELMDVDQLDPLTSGRTIPHAIPAEQAVLGAMMLSTTAADEIIGLITSRDFYNAKHATIYAVLTAQLAAGEPVDPLSLAHALDRVGKLGSGPGQVSVDYLHTLVAAVPTAASGTYYARIVAEKAQQRRLIEVGTRIAELGYGAAAGSRDPQAAAEQAQQWLHEATTSSTGDDLDVIGDWLDDVVQHLDDVAAGRIPRGISTGLGALDQLLGGWKPGQLVIPAGRPGMGKTVLAVGFARTAARRGHRVAVFATEMSRRELTVRLLSDVAEIPMDSLATGQITRHDMARIREAQQEIGQWPLHIYDQFMTPASIQATVRRLIQRYGHVDLVVVDYLQRLTPDAREERRDLEVGEFARSLKTMAQQLGTTVIAPSQLNRGLEHRVDRRPQLADLRESGALEQEADVVILIHREDYYDRESQRRGEADLIVAKHRNGPTDTVTVAAQLHFSRFVDMAI